MHRVTVAFIWIISSSVYPAIECFADTSLALSAGAVVNSIYAKYARQEGRPDAYGDMADTWFAKSTVSTLRGAQTRQQKEEEPPGSESLRYDPFIGAGAGYHVTAVDVAEHIHGDAGRVIARFNDNEIPQVVVFDMVYEHGGWKIWDIHADMLPSWRMYLIHAYSGPHAVRLQSEKNAAIGDEYYSEQPLVCPTVHRLLEASISDFSAIKLQVKSHFLGGSDWVPSITVGDPADCEGQTDRKTGSTMSCRLIDSTSLDEVRIWYSALLDELHSCLDSRFLFKERQGGPESNLFTPIKSASFRVDGGPAVRVRLDNVRSKTSSSYGLSLWVDAVHND